MKQLIVFSAALFSAIHLVQSATHSIKSGDDLEEIIESGTLAPGDVIEWVNGEYSDQELNISGVNGTEKLPITRRFRDRCKRLYRHHEYWLMAKLC